MENARPQKPISTHWKLKIECMNTKMLILGIVMFMTFLVTEAQQVSLSEAVTVATNAYRYGYVSDTYNSPTPIDTVFEKNINNHTVIYEVQYRNGMSILISGNKSCNPILGILDSTDIIGTSVFDQQMPLALQDLLSWYSNQISSSFDDQTSKQDLSWNYLLEYDSTIHNRNTRAVRPLLTSKWGQTKSNDSPPYPHAYNYYVYDRVSPCYDQNGIVESNVPAGCVAVAMGQIMRYWGTLGYDVSNPAVCWEYDWSEMSDKLIHNNNNSYETQRNAIAGLLRDCGTSVHMNYGCNGSGISSDSSYVICRALNNFGLTSQFEKKDDFQIEEWKNMIYSDLDNGLPILYEGLGPKYFDYYSMTYKQDGHAFVCDGYKSTLPGYKFHFNWGWLGQGNGYFTLDDLTPGSGNFSFNQMAIFNIQMTSCRQNLIFECDKIYSNGDVVEYSALNDIENNHHDFNIQNSASVALSAGKEIILTDGFYAAQGSSVLANIAPCGTGNHRNYIVEDDLMESSDYENNMDSKVCLNNEKIILYPNPTTGALNIQLSDSQDIISKVEITNILGNKVLKSEMTNAQIDVSSLQNGIYILKASTKQGKMLNAKFVKQ